MTIRSEAAVTFTDRSFLSSSNEGNVRTIQQMHVGGTEIAKPYTRALVPRYIPAQNISLVGTPGWLSGSSDCLWLRDDTRVLGSSPALGSLLLPLSAAPPACALALSLSD